MKLLFVIISNNDKKTLTKALIEKNFSITNISTQGGFMSAGNTTLMLGIDDDRVDEALEIIKKKSSKRQEVTVSSVNMVQSAYSVAVPMTVTVGGATVFVVDVNSHYKF